MEPSPADSKSVLLRLSLLDRYLPVWILLSMLWGVLLGVYSPTAREKLGGESTIHVAGVSLPIAIGLWLMMLPVLTKVQYGLLRRLTAQRSVATQLLSSTFLNWVIGPALMTGLAWATLFDLPGYRNGVVMVGLARCIAMVLIWNELAGGDAELCAITVAMNSVLQILLYAPLALLYVGPGTLGSGVDGFWLVAKSVLVFLGVPLAGGVLLRAAILRCKGRQWLDQRFLPYFGPVALLALLYTIVVMFASQGNRIVDEIGNVCRVAVPLLIYFLCMFVLALAMSWALGAPYAHAATQAFTAASNNFELAIAVVASVFGVTSDEALAATVGPLVEVPVLVSLVYVALWVRRRWWDARDIAISGARLSSIQPSDSFKGVENVKDPEKFKDIENSKDFDNSKAIGVCAPAVAV